MSENKFCSNCGTKININSKFCKHCGTKMKNDSSDKRAKVIGKRNKNNFRIINVIVAAVFAVIIFTYFSTTKTKEATIIAGQPQISESAVYPPSGSRMKSINAEVRDGKVIISVDQVKKYKFVSFAYKGTRNMIPLLAYINEDGKVVTAVRMCEPCNSQSFQIKGSSLVCDACGTTWNINNLDAISGSCGKYPPDPLPSIIVGNEIQINESIISNWTSRV